MISVVIPVYKKTEELLNNLTHNLPFLTGCEIIIVNDDPQTSLQEVLKKYHTIKLLENEENQGFASSVNRGIYQAKGEFVFLLNSDVQLQNDNFKKTISFFKDQTLFAVGLAQKEKNGAIVGRNSLYRKWGLTAHKASNSLTPGPTAWAEGGSSLFDKKKLLYLGGFDPIYKPFYWEDIDLSYRAWKAGYRVLFENNVEVLHHHNSTIGSFYSSKKIETISYRNGIIFTWKNITSTRFILNHLMLLPFYLLIEGLLKRNTSLIAGFFQALIRLPQILEKRVAQKKLSKLSDQQVLKQIT